MMTHKPINTITEPIVYANGACLSEQCNGADIAICNGFVRVHWQTQLDAAQNTGHNLMTMVNT